MLPGRQIQTSMSFRLPFLRSLLRLSRPMPRNGSSSSFSSWCWSAAHGSFRPPFSSAHCCPPGTYHMLPWYPLPQRSCFHIPPAPATAPDIPGCSSQVRCLYTSFHPVFPVSSLIWSLLMTSAGQTQKSSLHLLSGFPGYSHSLQHRPLIRNRSCHKICLLFPDGYTMYSHPRRTSCCFLRQTS